MSERLKVAISKVAVGETPPRVRIPLSPDFFLPKKNIKFCKFAQTPLYQLF